MMIRVRLLGQYVAENISKASNDRTKLLLSSIFAITFLLPLCLVGSCHKSGGIFAELVDQSAYAAAYGASVPDMSAQSQQRYARKLRSKVKKNSQYLAKMHKYDVLVTFDEPELVRLDGSVSSWQYKSEVCVMDVFFAQNDDKTDEQANNVIYYEIRPRHTASLLEDNTDKVKHLAQGAEQECLGSLLQVHNVPDRSAHITSRQG